MLELWCSWSVTPRCHSHQKCHLHLLSSSHVLNSGVRAIDCYMLLDGRLLLEAVVSAVSVEVINVVYHRQYYLSANHKPEGNWNCKERKPIQANSGEDWKAVSKRKTIWRKTSICCQEQLSFKRAAFRFLRFLDN